MKEDENKIYSFDELYEKEIRIIFIVFSIIAILGSVHDFFTSVKILDVFNLVTIGILLSVIFIQLKHKSSLKYSFAVVIYTLALNIFISMFFENTENSLFVLAFLRNSIFQVILLIFAGLFIDRLHSIILLGLLIIQNVYFTVDLKSQFLVENIGLLLVTYCALTFAMWYFSGKLHNSVNTLQRNKTDLYNNNIELQEKTEDLVALSDEHRSTTEELYEKNKLLFEENISKDKFFSIISHDLKNMVNTINGFSELLKEDYEKLSDEKRQFYISVIGESGKNIHELLDDILNWSRVHSNKMVCEPVVFEIHKTTESVCFFLKQVALKKKITLINKIEKNLMVFADYNMIFTVLRNLVSNAIKFSYPESEIVISAENKNQQILVKVSDKGMGMDEKDREKLFRIDSTHSTKGTDNETGTGMGLILCQEFIEKNNGEIGAESLKDKGSTFWFTLPIGKK